MQDQTGSQANRAQEVTAPAGGGPLLIDFFTLSRLIWLRKWTVLVLVLLGLLAGLATAFLMTPVYRAETILVPVSDEAVPSGISALGGQFGGLASLAGVNLNSGDRNEEFVAILKSREFTYRFIEKEALLPVLFEGIYDAERGEWILDENETPPSLEDGYRVFNNKVRQVWESKSGNLLTLAIDWKDANLAAKWANTLVTDVNRQIRKRMIAEYEKSIDYLEAEVENTSVVEVRQVIFELMQEQISKIMLTNVREEYAFKVVDRAVPPEPEDHIRPKRLLIIAAGAFVGFLLGVLVAVMRSMTSFARDG